MRAVTAPKIWGLVKAVTASEVLQQCYNMTAGEAKYSKASKALTNTEAVIDARAFQVVTAAVFISAFQVVTTSDFVSAFQVMTTACNRFSLLLELHQPLY